MVLKLGHSSQSPEEGFVKALIAGPHPHISDSGVKPENLHFCFNFLAVLDRHRLARAFSSCGEQGLCFIAARRLLLEVPSIAAEHRLQVRGLP